MALFFHGSSSELKASKHGSNLVFESISKCDEVDLQSTLMSDITEIGGFGDDGSNIINRDSTESLCSNPLSVTLPSFSNYSYQEASKEAYSFRNCGDSSCESGREVNEKFKDEFWVNESSASSIIESSKLVLKHEDPFVAAGFDLTEEIDINNCVASMVIRVVAKSGVCIGKPTLPLKFEGELGWKGFAETSAFRPATPSKIGMDLNVAVLEDGSPSTLQAKSFCIDLNYPYNAANESFQPPLLPNSDKPPLLDLNSSVANTLIEYKSDLPHWLVRPQRYLRNRTLDSANQGKEDFVFTSPDCLSSMHNVVNNSHTLNTAQRIGLMQRVASLQHKLPFMAPSQDPIHFVPGLLPYTGYSNEHRSLLHKFSPGVQPFQAPMNCMQIVCGQSVPRFDFRTEENIPTSGSNVAKIPQMGESVNHRELWNPPSMKRKEPEGGLGHYQLGHR